MLRSIATVSLGGTLMEKLNAIAAAGFDGVEIFENDLLYFDGSPRDVKQIAADLGFEDEAYFGRLFRKQTGSTPSAFRAMARGRLAG